MIVLFTDFGLSGPYTGQVKAVLHRHAPGVAIVDLFADAPCCNPRAAAYLLAAYSAWFPAGTVFLAIVDPGVGGDRRPVILDAAGRWFVGPDNGLFELVSRRAGDDARWWPIDAPPGPLPGPPSPSFHGRDLFAPAAARLATGQRPETPPASAAGLNRFPHWPDDLAEVVYIDGYGNAMTGLRAALMSGDAEIDAGDHILSRARTFSSRAPGEAFWYENANGLVEIAVNLGRADQALGLRIGTPVVVRDSKAPLSTADPETGWRPQTQ